MHSWPQRKNGTLLWIKRYSTIFFRFKSYFSRLTASSQYSHIESEVNFSFVVMSAENIRTEHSALLQVNETVKIQSSQSIKQSNRRRHQAMRRCLMMATIQVSLNAPYYTLQLCDEIFSLRTSTHVYLYLDAFLYFIYLTQFSMIYFYTNLLVSPRGKSCRWVRFLCNLCRCLELRKNFKIKKRIPWNCKLSNIIFLQTTSKNASELYIKSSERIYNGLINRFVTIFMYSCCDLI